MANPITIAIDAMGGDNSPEKVIEGISLHSKKSIDVNYSIFGDENLIIPLIKKYDLKDNTFRLTHTKEKVEGEDTALSAAKKGKNTSIKILDKISSKNVLIKLINGKEQKYKDLSIKSMKCSNSEFDDNPEIIAYIQVKDLTNKSNDDVFVFNGWMFSSSPSIKPFDHPVYDIWLVGCS